MKIAFYRHSLLTRGGDRMVVAYANFLAERSHEVVLYANVLDTKFQISSKVTIKRIPMPGKFGTILWGLTHLVDADFLIADIIAMSVFLSVRHGRKVLYFAQDYDIFYYRARVLRALTNFLYFIGLRCLHICCITVSKNLKNDLQRFSKTPCIVENGIDFRVFFREQDNALMELKQERKAVVFLGRKDYRKGLTTIFKFLNVLDKEKFEFWIVGERIHNPIFSPKIRNFGYVDQATLRKILSSADVAFSPSIYEGFGLFVVEALACGCPTVTTKAVKFMQHLETGWIFDLSNPDELQKGILALTQQGALRERIVKNGYALAQKYDIQKSCQLFEECLLDTLNGKRKKKT